MKHARKALVFLILLVTPLLLAGVLPPAIDTEVEAMKPPSSMKINTLSYEEIQPILALGDEDMDDLATDLSWEGNGMPDTPYIIEGYNITSNSDCIRIEDTTRAFEIRNCYLSSLSSTSQDGVAINNATQGAVIDTVIEKKSNGIIVYHSPAFLVDNCTIHESGYGIEFDYSHGGQITGCHIYENTEDSMYLYHSNDTTIDDNEIYDCTTYGIALSSSHHSTIENNLIAYCGYAGLDIGSSHYVVIENNNIHDNDLIELKGGINLGDSPYASVVGNEIYNNTRNGIFLDGSDWAYIFDNEIYGNSDHGIDARMSANGTILQNNIHSNGWWPAIMNEHCGIHIAATIDWVISDNTIWNNTPSGISVVVSERLEISNNHIFNNTDTGIFCLGGEGIADLSIVENEVHHNGWLDVDLSWDPAGILIVGYEGCSVNDNLAYWNYGYGISVNGDNNEIIGNVVYESETGIGTEECYFNLVSENIVYNCLGGILVVNVGTNVTYNIVYDNEYGIYMDWSGDCLIYGNDVGWNTVNAYEIETFEGQPLIWDDNISIGNHWHDYDGGDSYDIWNATDVTNVDRFPAISLNVSQAAPIDFEILETGNVVEWDAYALNPSHYEIFVDGSSVLVEDWDGGPIEYLIEGLSHGAHTVGVEVFHISGHSMENGTTADVEDLTPPSDIEGPAHIAITVGESISEQYTSEDPSGIDTWAVNNTASFAISSTGLLTNIVDLPVGDYVVKITVTDVHGHSTFTDVTVTVRAATGGGLPSSLVLAIGGIGAVGVLVVVIVLYKTKKG